MSIAVQSTVELAPWIVAPEDERAQPYLAAFESWLANKAPATQRAYRAAHADLLAFTGRAWWQIESADVRAWLADLGSRPIAPLVRQGLERCRGRAAGRVGLSDSTISLYLAAISSFYHYAATQYLLPSPGGERPLHERANPAQGLARPRQTAPWAASAYLDRHELRAFLRAIADSARRSPLNAARDDALFRTLILTGMRHDVIRLMRWGDLVESGSTVLLRWSSKGKSGLTELPGSAWAAIRSYLDLAGRLGSVPPGESGRQPALDCARRSPGAIAAGDYIFVAHNDHARRLGNAPAGGNRPLSQSQINRLMKRYARSAGLQPERMHVHLLRHSAAMLLDAAGAREHEIQAFLHHSSLATTGRCLHALRGDQSNWWMKVEDFLK